MKAFLSKIAQEHAANPDLSAADLGRRISETSEPADAAREPTRAPEEIALDRASLVAAFDLDELIAGLPGDGTAASVETARSALLRGSTAAGDGTLRILRTAERHDRLDELLDSGRLEAELQATQEFVPELDDAGLARQNKALRNTLAAMASNGASAALDALEPSPFVSATELRTRLQALNWILPDETEDSWLNARLARTRTEFRQRISNMESREKLRVEADAFVGREPLLGSLADRLFLDRPSADVPIVAIHGIGGIGKSAILAALVDRLWDLNPNLLVARLDFDRPGFGTARPDYLTQQIVDQLAAQAGISDVEDFSGVHYYSRGSDMEVASENTDSSTLQFEEIRRQIGLERHVLLILDTLEERQRQGPSAVSQLAFWLEQLTRTPGADALAIIVAGRARPDANDYYFPDYTDLPIDELEIAERRALFESLGNTEDGAARLAPLSGNPLLIHLVSRLVQRDGGPTVDQICGDGAENEADVLQGMIYDRILGHVEDPRARDLAYPGLVLREVTPEIIAKVVAPVVLDRDIDMEEASALFEALRREVWLVESDGPDRVRHRADVRRLMMGYLANDEKVTAAAADIHKRAIKHFQAENKSREVAYHNAMTSAPETIEDLPRITAQQWLEDIGGDIDFVPRAVSAALRANAGERLSDEEIALLPDRLWARFTDELGPELVEEDDLRRARRLWKDGRGLRQPAWLLETRDGLGDTLATQEIWDNLDDIAAAARKALFVRVALRNEDWVQAYGISRQAAGLVDNLSTSKTILSSQSDSVTRDVTDILALVSYNTLADAILSNGETNAAFQDREALRWHVLSRAIDFVDFRLTRETPKLAKLDRSSLVQLEELHRIYALFLYHHKDPFEFEIPGVSRFQFVPSLDWIETAHAAARDAREHLRSWGGLQRRITREVEGSSQLRISDITQEMASEAVSTISRLPRPYQKMPVFRGTGYRDHRQPLRYAIAEAVHGRDIGLAEAVAILRSLCVAARCIVPTEIHAPQVTQAQSIEAVDIQMVPIVHYADQCGLLPAYASALAEAFPESEKLNRVARNLSHWAVPLPPPNFTPEANTPVV